MSENLERLREILGHKKSKTYYAERLGITVDEVNELLEEIRAGEFVTNEAEISNYISELEDRVVKENFDKGTLESSVVTNFEPKNPEELAELHKIDLSKYKISTYWTKLKSNGKFTSSVLCTLIKDEDILEKELLEEIKKVFSKTEKYKGARRPETNPEKALFVYIADDHAGIDFKDSLFGNPYSATIYQDRLLKLANETLEYNRNEGCDVLYIINLGDELDGFNSKTTRQDHSLDSLSNKEQFNIYTTARKKFYDFLFESGNFSQIIIININNSNHSGNDYSYIVNKALEFYLDARYSNISFINQEKFISTYEFGLHSFAITHGKDQKYMKYPMPLNLDFKTDLWLMDYHKNSKGRFIHTIKGDLHSYSINFGKSGRYVNVPSICGGSNWIELNYGSSYSGALIEIVEKENKNIISIPIWF